MKLNKVNFIWDVINVRLLAYLLKDEYEAAGMWPENGIDVSDEASRISTDSGPEGKTMVVKGAMGCQRGWIPPPTREGRFLPQNRFASNYWPMPTLLCWIGVQN
ncbi:hypothetical protein [Citrobacter freundii]|uniref:hypothetical protein n=1 Tax=Citrobacter freundii TaxID=546 RepID=UPI002B2E2D3D|nr:hypothetical protein OIPHN354_35430 [Citrobacter freundii]